VKAPAPAGVPASGQPDRRGCCPAATALPAHAGHRPGTRACRRLWLEQLQPRGAGEVLEILQIQGGQRQLAGKADTNPGAGDRARPPAPDRRGRQAAPAAMALLPGDDRLAGEPAAGHREITRAPVTEPGPPGQPADVTKVATGCLARQGGSQPQRKPLPERSRRDVSTPDDGLRWRLRHGPRTRTRSRTPGTCQVPHRYHSPGSLPR
jgi:hypothetical protein